MLVNKQCYWCEEIGHHDSEIYLCQECGKKLFSRQWKGKSYKDADDNFAVKTIHGQIFQGFKTVEEATAWANTTLSEKNFKIIESGYFLENSDLLFNYLMQKKEPRQ